MNKRRAAGRAKTVVLPRSVGTVEGTHARPESHLTWVLRRFARATSWVTRPIFRIGRFFL